MRTLSVILYQHRTTIFGDTIGVLAILALVTSVLALPGM
jgi:hypothetical protein